MKYPASSLNSKNKFLILGCGFSGSFFAKKLFDTKKATDAPMEAEMKTIIDPKYEPYKKPDNKDNQEAGSINKTIKI